MVSSEVTSLQEEEGAMDRLTSDVLSIVLGGREGGRGKEREGKREGERGGGRVTDDTHTHCAGYVYTCAYVQSTSTYLVN